MHILCNPPKTNVRWFSALAWQSPPGPWSPSSAQTWWRGGGREPAVAGLSQSSSLPRILRLILKTRSCSRGGSPHPSLSSKSVEKQQEGKLRHFSQSGGKASSLSQSVGRPSSGLSTEVSKSHRRASSRHSSHGAGRPSSQMSSRLSVSRFCYYHRKVLYTSPHPEIHPSNPICPLIAPRCYICL